MLSKTVTQQSGLKLPGHSKTGEGSILAEGSTLPESTLRLISVPCSSVGRFDENIQVVL